MQLPERLIRFNQRVDLLDDHTEQCIIIVKEENLQRKYFLLQEADSYKKSEIFLLLRRSISRHSQHAILRVRGVFAREWNYSRARLFCENLALQEWEGPLRDWFTSCCHKEYTQLFYIRTRGEDSKIPRCEGQKKSKQCFCAKISTICTSIWRNGRSELCFSPGKKKGVCHNKQ